jgi:hypothetical protein
MELASALANFCISICGKTPQQVKQRTFFWIWTNFSFKRTVSQDRFGFRWHVCSGPKKGTRPFILLFRCSNDFITQKLYFSQFMRAYVGLLVACTIVHVPSPDFFASYWSAGFGTFLQVAALAWTSAWRVIGKILHVD